MSKINYKVENNILKVGLDSDGNGQNSIDLNLNLTEAIAEAFAKGEKVEGVNVVGVRFSGTKLIVVVDSDRDGEFLLTLEVDLFEAIKETGILK